MILILQPANFCDNYPITNYTLEVQGPTTHTQVIQPPSKSFNPVNNLLDNQMYMYRIIVSNAVGDVPTKHNKICKS